MNQAPLLYFAAQASPAAQNSGYPLLFVESLEARMSYAEEGPRVERSGHTGYGSQAALSSGSCPLCLARSIFKAFIKGFSKAFLGQK